MVQREGVMMLLAVVTLLFAAMSGSLRTWVMAVSRSVSALRALSVVASAPPAHLRYSNASTGAACVQIALHYLDVAIAVINSELPEDLRGIAKGALITATWGTFAGVPVSAAYTHPQQNPPSLSECVLLYRAGGCTSSLGTGRPFVTPTSA